MQITVFCADIRLCHSAAYLAARGHCVYTVGASFFPTEACPSSPALPFGEVLTALSATERGSVGSILAASDLWLLPIPLTRDGTHLSGVLSEISLSALLPLLSEGVSVAAGKLPDGFRHEICSRGARAYDYALSPSFIRQNSLLSAEGAVAAATSRIGALAGRSVAVIGYGALGEALVSILLARGCTVYVYARRESALSAAATLGAHPRPIREGRALFDGTLPFSVVFNTVPAPLFGDSTLRALGGGVLFELACTREVVDAEAARAHGVVTVTLPGIPSKYRPDLAGEAVADAALSCLDASP